MVTRYGNVKTENDHIDEVGWYDYIDQIGWYSYSMHLETTGIPLVAAIYHWAAAV